MRNTLQLLLSIIFLCASLSVSGQDEKLLDSKKLAKDWKEFVTFFEAHPDPYTHTSKEVFDQKFAEVEASLDKPHTVLDFYKKIASLVALIKDGHSSVFFPRFWGEEKRKEFGCFPYEMHLTNDDQLYILKDLNNGGIKPGSKIIAINGISVDSFLNIIDPFVSYEIHSFRNTIIDDNFEKYLYLAFGQSHDITLTHKKTETLETVVTPMPFKEWKKSQKNEREERDKKIAIGEPYAYKLLKNGVGKIDIYGFNAPDIDAYNAFLIKTFRKIQKDSVHSLVIDIRGNYGGWPKIASELFHYISDGHFKTMARSKMKVSQAYKESYYDQIPAKYRNDSQITFSQRRHFVDIAAILRNKVGTFVTEEAFFNEAPIEENYEFKGDLYVLTDRDSYSAASSFASTFQCYSMGTIIGEETGGTKIFRANPIGEVLYKSGIGVRLSTTILYTPCFTDEFQGVIPHIEFSPNIFQIVADTDTQLSYALRIIKKVQQKKKEKVLRP